MDNVCRFACFTRHSSFSFALSALLSLYHVFCLLLWFTTPVVDRVLLKSGMLTAVSPWDEVITGCQVVADTGIPISF